MFDALDLTYFPLVIPNLIDISQYWGLIIIPYLVVSCLLQEGKLPWSLSPSGVAIMCLTECQHYNYGEVSVGVKHIRVDSIAPQKRQLLLAWSHTAPEQDENLSTGRPCIVWHDAVDKSERQLNTILMFLTKNTNARHTI